MHIKHSHKINLDYFAIIGYIIINYIVDLVHFLFVYFLCIFYQHIKINFLKHEHTHAHISHFSSQLQGTANFCVKQYLWNSLLILQGGIFSVHLLLLLHVLHIHLMVNYIGKRETCEYALPAEISNWKSCNGQTKLEIQLENNCQQRTHTQKTHKYTNTHAHTLLQTDLNTCRTNICPKLRTTRVDCGQKFQVQNI